MFTQLYRPSYFKEIKGQTIPVQVMLRTVQNPSEAPRVYIFHGQYGTGKTSLARIFARALNCQYPKKGEPCGLCENCKSSLDTSPFFKEFDCGDSGNIDDLRAIREDIIVNSGLAKYQVIVLDEFHNSSRQAQSTLLKILEELKSNTFVIICTTDVEKILETLRSRAINLQFSRLPAEDVFTIIKGISVREGVQVSDATLNLVVALSRGHVRDAIMNLELIRIIGDQEFTTNIPKTEENILRLLIAIREKDQTTFETALRSLSESPLVKIKDSFYHVLENGIKFLSLRYTEISVYENLYQQLLKCWKYDLIKLFQNCVSNWAVNAFTSDLTLQTFFRSLWLMFQ